MAAPDFSPSTPPDVAGPPARRHLAQAPSIDASATGVELPGSSDRRSFALYEPLAAFDLIEELEFLTARSIEPVAFYAPEFLVPAMPRLDDRRLRLMVARDEAEHRSRLRLLMPFSVEATGLVGGPRCVRAWTHPFGPRGTLPLDHDDPCGTLASLLEALRDPARGLPPLFVLPDLRLDGPVARTLLGVARRRGLPHLVVETRRRACLHATGDPQAFLASALSPRRRRELSRQRRKLEVFGEVSFEIARRPDEIRDAIETFLTLEASGWKGRARSAILDDRYRAAFAREAVDGMARHDRVRIYTLKAGERAAASLVVFVAEGEAVLWKTAYDEAFSAASPGFQLMAEVSRALVADPAVRFVDSCAVPDHTLINRIWRSRIEIGTLVLGLRPDGERNVKRAAAALRRARHLRHAFRRARRSLGFAA